MLLKIIENPSFCSRGYMYCYLLKLKLRNFLNMSLSIYFKITIIKPLHGKINICVTNSNLQNKRNMVKRVALF